MISVDTHQIHHHHGLKKRNLLREAFKGSEATFLRF